MRNLSLHVSASHLHPPAWLWLYALSRHPKSVWLNTYHCLLLLIQAAGSLIVKPPTTPYRVGAGIETFISFHGCGNILCQCSKWINPRTLQPLHAAWLTAGADRIDCIYNDMMVAHWSGTWINKYLGWQWEGKDHCQRQAKCTLEIMRVRVRKVSPGHISVL